MLLLHHKCAKEYIKYVFLLYMTMSFKYTLRGVHQYYCFPLCYCLRHYCINCFFKPSPPPLFLLFADDLTSYFTKKIQVNRRVL